MGFPTSKLHSVWWQKCRIVWLIPEPCAPRCTEIGYLTFKLAQKNGWSGKVMTHHVWKLSTVYFNVVHGMRRNRGSFPSPVVWSAWFLLQRDRPHQLHRLWRLTNTIQFLSHCACSYIGLQYKCIAFIPCWTACVLQYAYRQFCWHSLNFNSNLDPSLTLGKCSERQQTGKLPSVSFRPGRPTGTKSSTCGCNRKVTNVVVKRIFANIKRWKSCLYPHPSSMFEEPGDVNASSCLPGIEELFHKLWSKADGLPRGTIL